MQKGENKSNAGKIIVLEMNLIDSMSGGVGSTKACQLGAVLCASNINITLP